MELSVDGILSRILELSPDQQVILLSKWRSSEDECAAQIVIEEIGSSTGPTGGWLDSPKAVCAAIVARLLPGNGQVK